MPLKRLNHFLAIGRRNDMSNEGLRPQLPDAHLPLARQRMARRNHENQFIQIDDYGMKLRFLRIVS